MRKTINNIIVGTLVTGLVFGGAMSTLTLPAAAKAQPTSRINIELPDYEHETEGKMIEEVYDYVEDDIGDFYPEAAVGIPCPIIIDIDESKLPSPEEVAGWDADTYARTLRHNQKDPLYNPSFRQLIHVSYKIAAELGDEFYPALEKHTDVIGEQITANLCERHIKRLFPGK